MGEINGENTSITNAAKKRALMHTIVMKKLFWTGYSMVTCLFGPVMPLDPLVLCMRFSFLWRTFHCFKFCWFVTKIYYLEVLLNWKVSVRMFNMYTVSNVLPCFPSFSSKSVFMNWSYWSPPKKLNFNKLRPVEMLSEQGKIFHYYFKITGLISIILNMIIIVCLSYDFLLLGVFSLGHEMYADILNL